MKPYIEYRYEILALFLADYEILILKKGKTKGRGFFYITYCQTCMLEL